MTTLRSSSAGRGAAASGAPHAPQNRKPWGLSCPHLEQLAIPAVYGEAPEPRGVWTIRPRVISITDPPNLHSLAVMRRLGMDR